MKRTRLPRPKKRLERKTRLRSVSPRRRARSGVPGKLGIVRLYGPDLTALRRMCFERDGYTCVDCHQLVAWDIHDARALQLPVGEMSHVRNKRMYGDTLENVVTRCRSCHRESHTRGNS